MACSENTLIYIQNEETISYKIITIFFVDGFFSVAVFSFCSFNIVVFLHATLSFRIGKVFWFCCFILSWNFNLSSERQAENRCCRFKIHALGMLICVFALFPESARVTTATFSSKFYENDISVSVKHTTFNERKNEQTKLFNGAAYKIVDTWPSSIKISHKCIHTHTRTHKDKQHRTQCSLSPWLLKWIIIIIKLCT